MSQGGFLQEVTVGSYNIHYSHLPLPDDDDDFLPGLHVDAADANLGDMFDDQVKSEYDMGGGGGGGGDLFKAPEPFLVEAELELDPMAIAMPIIYGGDDVITEIIKVASMESIQNYHLGGLFYECKKDLLEESEMENSISELLDVKIPAVQIDEVPPSEDLSHADGSMQKSISSGCLNSVEWVPRSTMRPEFLDFKELDFEAAFGLKRSYSEGDLRNLGTKNTRIGSTTAVCSSFEQLLTISDLKTELRQLKLSRYREKKSKRNFGKKIKYACRKALADSQPRVRGRFAKTEECKHVDASIKADKL
ncbi:hypothetical protein OPV22_031497 [Ensete ventricosum]|uniref:CCT domain-containing protein n=1 Tax=Ensete ventricosum TaxID=4639 RepID=A0AAV8P194_ENSVE|nr:hypothetical protein OPV22_031497 [Ensete ventricosum]